MKSYDETVSTVFDRIHAYNVKKQHRAVLARRITASCCAVSLLGGSVWYLNHAPEDAPVTMITDGNTDTTTVRNSTFSSSATATETHNTLSTTAPVTAAPSGSTTESKTKAPSTTITTTPTQTTAAPSVSTTRSATESTTAATTPQKILITADEPDVYGDVSSGILSRNKKYISPTLQEKMKLYSNDNVVFSVIVELPITIEDYNSFSSTDEELLRLEKEREAAYQEFLDAEEQYRCALDESEKRQALFNMRDKQQAFQKIASEWSALYRKLENEYLQDILNQRKSELTLLSKNELVPLSTDTRFYPFFALNADDAFFMELTANQINEVAERGGYVIRLVFPEGDQPMDMPE